MFPLTCQCDGARWVAAAHRVVMDTLCVQLGLIRGLTLLSRHHSPSLSIVDEFNKSLYGFGDAVSKLEMFVWILNHVSRSIAWSLFTLKPSYLVK